MEFRGLRDDVYRRPLATALDRLGIGPGWTCVDVGAGGGDVSVALAEIVGREGRVYAVDSDPTARDEVAEAAAAHSQVLAITQSGEDLRLPEAVGPPPRRGRPAAVARPRRRADHGRRLGRGTCGCRAGAGGRLPRGPDRRRPRGRPRCAAPPGDRGSPGPRTLRLPVSGTAVPIAIHESVTLGSDHRTAPFP